MENKENKIKEDTSRDQLMISSKKLQQITLITIIILILFQIIIVLLSVFIGIKIGKRELNALKKINKQSESLVIENKPVSNIEIKISPTLKSNNKSTFNLQTYRDNKYGFSFYYPENWKVETKPESDVSLISISKDHIISIMIWKVTGFGYCYKYGEQKEIIVGGKTATTADGVGTGDTEICEESREKMSKLGNTFVIIALEENEDFPKSIHISYDYPLSDINIAKSNLNQILSTFKFDNNR